MSARERRLIALGLLVAAVAIVWLAVLSPILHGFATRGEARAAAELQLERNARLISSMGMLRAEVAAQRRAMPIYAISAASEPAAVQVARDRTAKAAAAAGGSLQALRVQPAPARQVRLQADVRIDLAGLSKLIRLLEDERPYATVDGLFITAPDVPTAGSPSPLEVRLDVSYGYF